MTAFNCEWWGPTVRELGIFCHSYKRLWHFTWNIASLVLLKCRSVGKSWSNVLQTNHSLATYEPKHDGRSGLVCRCCQHSQLDVVKSHPHSQIWILLLILSWIFNVKEENEFSGALKFHYMLICAKTRLLRDIKPHRAWAIMLLAVESLHSSTRVWASTRLCCWHVCSIRFQNTD